MGFWMINIVCFDWTTQQFILFELQFFLLIRENLIKVKSECEDEGQGWRYLHLQSGSLVLSSWNSFFIAELNYWYSPITYSQFQLYRHINTHYVIIRDNSWYVYHHRHIKKNIQYAKIMLYRKLCNCRFLAEISSFINYNYRNLM